MLKKIFLILIILSSVLFSMSILKIEKKEVFHNEIILLKKTSIKKEKIIEEPIGSIQIPRISLEKPLYSTESKKNNIEENVTILQESIPPDKENSILFLAAHSGEGEIAFFNRLDELQIEDEVTITYQKEIYQYQVKDIVEQPKDGYIRGIKEATDQLVLTTCCPKKENCQLIINCIKKES